MKYWILTLSLLLSSILLVDARPRRKKHQSKRSKHRVTRVVRRSSGGGNYKSVWIAPHQVDCNGVAPLKCFQVKYSPQEEWQTYSGAIDRFKFVEGFEYQIKVKEIKLKNPPADAPDTKWTLVRVVSKQEPELPKLPLASQWILSAYYTGNAWEGTNSKSAYLTIARDLKGFSGTGGCNRLRGNLEANGTNVTFSQIISTKMACDKLQAETRFIEALGKANRFDIVGGELTLFDGQTPLMKLESYR